jgi:hypothetical protein
MYTMVLYTGVRKTKATKCQVCGGSAMPVYLRVWVASDKDGKDHLQFVNFGTVCDSPECAAIVLDGEVYRKTGQQKKTTTATSRGE